MPSPQASVRLSRSRLAPPGAGAGLPGIGVGCLQGGLGGLWRWRCLRGLGRRCGCRRLLAAPHRADGGSPRDLRRRTGRRRRLRRRGRLWRGPALGGPWACTSSGRRSGPRKGGRSGVRTLQDADPFRERLHSGIEVRSHGTHHGDLEHDLRVGCLTHVDQRVAEDLHAAHHPCQSHRLGQRAEPLERGSGHRAQLGRQRGEEDLAKVVDQLCGQLLGAPTAGQQRAERDEHPADVTVRQGLEHRGELGSGRVCRTRRHDLVQRWTTRRGPNLGRAAPRPRAPPRRRGVPPPR